MNKAIPISLAVVGILCAGGVAAAAVISSGAEEVQEQIEQEVGILNTETAKDIKLTTCKREDFGGVTAWYTIVSSQPQTTSYGIAVDITDSEGTRVGEANAFEQDVQPGATVKGKAYGSITGDGKIKCKIRVS